MSLNDQLGTGSCLPATKATGAASHLYTGGFSQTLFVVPVRDAELCRRGHFIDVDLG